MLPGSASWTQHLRALNGAYPAIGARLSPAAALYRGTVVERRRPHSKSMLLFTVYATPRRVKECRRKAFSDTYMGPGYATRTERHTERFHFPPCAGLMQLGGSISAATKCLNYLLCTSKFTRELIVPNCSCFKDASQWDRTAYVGMDNAVEWNVLNLPPT